MSIMETIPSDVITDPEQEKDPEQYAHYADKLKVIAGYINGTPVTAFCGYVFVPKRDPEALPVCPPCQDIYNRRGQRFSN